MKKFKVGLQLYSVREHMEENLEGTLKAVKEMGYDYVETAGYFGKSAEELRKIFDDNGLKCISVHQKPEFFFEKGKEAYDFVKKLGAKYSAIPWCDKNLLAGTEKWNNTKELILKLGSEMAENGLKLLYHNHDFEFRKFQGKFVEDYILDLGKDIINPEFDTCWINYAGEESTEFIEKYNGRVDIIHLKDFDCKKLGGGPAYKLIDENGNPMDAGSKEDNEFRFKPLGQGRMNFLKILESAEKSGTEYIIVEQDDWYDMTGLECAKQSREYLRSLGQ